MSSGECLPEFYPLLEQMLKTKHLKTPQWLNGRRFQRRLYQAIHHTAEADRIDAFVYPTVNRQPISLEKMPPGSAPELAAISGLPALTMPCGAVKDGLPVGMELLAKRRDEHSLLSLALACENALHPLIEPS
jgi:Asp-tRNA(Asn)/Glu-tRNA(Gln) amidotransferase A subunit family amidase